MNALWQSVVGLHFQFLEQFLVALLPIAVTVVIHGQAMHWVGRYYWRFSGHGSEDSGVSSRGMVPIVIVGIMLIAHFAEIGGWALFYVSTGLIDGAGAAMNLSVNAYTTLGASNVHLPLRWQGLDGLEAMSAMLMFGWSTAVLASAMRFKFI
jgi:hypothetical protein